MISVMFKGNGFRDELLNLTQNLYINAAQARYRITTCCELTGQDKQKHDKVYNIIKKRTNWNLN